MNSPDVVGVPNWGAVSIRGIRKPANEDAHAFFTLKWGKEDKTATVMIVADGISSNQGGARASQIAVETIRTALAEPKSGAETTSDRMAEALTLANQEILLEARQNPYWEQMGTTVVLALVFDARLYVMGLGDSRAYLIRRNRIHRLTTDHTWAQYTRTARNQSIDSFTVAQDDASTPNSPLVRYLGNPNGFHIDRGVLSPETREKEEYIPIQSNDTILLCSDGLYKSIPDGELNNVIADQSLTPNDMVSSLASHAQNKGETDDITALLLRLPELSKAVRDIEGERDVGQVTWLRARKTRLALAALIAVVLLVFQFGYRRSEDGNGTIIMSAPTRSTVDTAPSNRNSQVPPTVTPTSTATLQPNSSQEEYNSTIPPPLTLTPRIRARPTVALPTPSSRSKSN